MQLRRLRQAKGLSQQQLADKADIAKITIQRIENAKFNVTLDTLYSIADGLSIQVVDFFQTN